MKRLALAAILSGIAFSASALAPESEPAARAMKTIQIIETVTTPDEASATGDQQNPVAKIVKNTDVSCVQQTGSRIRSKSQSGTCNGEQGRVYTRENLGSGGRINLATSLRTLDVSIR